MNRATIRTKIREHLSESQADFFTDAKLNSWIDDAIGVVFLKVAGVDPDFFGVSKAYISFASGVREYSLPVVPFEIQKVVVEDRSFAPLVERDITEVYFYPESGEPHSYYWTVDYGSGSPQVKIGFIPKPDRTATNNVAVYYIPSPSPLTSDSQEPPFPEVFHPLIVLWATMEALRADNRPSAEIQAEFNFRLTSLLGFAARGKSGGPKYIHYVDEY